MTPSIPGAEQLVAWFGSWPSFHDAEIVELSLRREDKSWLRLDASRMTNQVDSAGSFVTDRRALISFWFEGVTDLELADFSAQNVIAALTCEENGNGFRVTIAPCFGIAGYIQAKQVSVSFEPSKPREAQRT
jgi:hypothetical protein